MKTLFIPSHTRNEIAIMLNAQTPAQISFVFMSQSAMAAFSAELSYLINIQPQKVSPMCQLRNPGNENELCYITWTAPNMEFAKRLESQLSANTLSLMADGLKETLTQSHGWLKDALLFHSGMHLPLATLAHPVLSIHEQSPLKPQFTQKAIDRIQCRERERQQVNFLFSPFEGDDAFFSLVEQLTKLTAQFPELSESFAPLIREIAELFMKDPLANSGINEHMIGSAFDLVINRFLVQVEAQPALLETIVRPVLKLRTSGKHYVPQVQFAELSPASKETLTNLVISDDEWDVINYKTWDITQAPSTNPFSDENDIEMRFIHLRALVADALSEGNTQRRFKELTAIADGLNDNTPEETLRLLTAFTQR